MLPSDFDDAKWICTQIGARERYFIPQALNGAGALEMLITDAWFPPEGPLAALQKRLAGRYNPTLADADVRAPNLSYLAFEMRARLLKTPPVDTMMQRNMWFQRQALKHLKSLKGDQPRILMGFSYASKDMFAYAKQRGWRTVLDQIDPGKFEEDLVARLEPDSALQKWPASYWELWREELALSDIVVVNSIWSRDALIAQGVEGARIRVVPLVYHGSGEAAPRHYPARFDADRPMRVIFLGQVIARKGVIPYFQAIEQLRDLPIAFDFVGPIGVEIPDAVRSNPNVHFAGSIPHSETSGYYQRADVFILPTLSDGFAVTQVEARHRRLPVIASRYCGAVVEDGVNGLILDTVDADTIAGALRRCVVNPAELQRMSDAEDRQFSEADMAQAWRGIWSHTDPIGYAEG